MPMLYAFYHFRLAVFLLFIDALALSRLAVFVISYALCAMLIALNA